MLERTATDEYAHQLYTDDHDTVDGHEFTRVHQQPVTDGDGGYRDLLDTAIDQPMRLARRAVDEGAAEPG